MSGMDHMSKMENSRYAAAAGFAVIILFLTANLFHIRQLWGINLPGFYSDFYYLYIMRVRRHTCHPTYNGEIDVRS